MTQKTLTKDNFGNYDGTWLQLQETNVNDPYFHGDPSAYITSGNTTRLYRIGEKLDSHNYYLSKVMNGSVILESIGMKEEKPPIQILPVIPGDLKPVPKSELPEKVSTSQSQETIINGIIFVLFMIGIIIVTEYFIKH